MKSMIFAGRNAKEIVRDPLTLAFGAGLPVVMIILFGLMQKNVPQEVFGLTTLVPAIAVFSFSFISLFLGLLVSKDRTSSYLQRLFSSPLSATDFIIGYSLPLLPIGILQVILCFIVGAFMGLSLSVGVLLVFVAVIPIALLYIGLGLLFGTAFSDKQVGGIFSLFVNLSTWLSGTWFPLEIIGDGFKTFGYLLPFAHAVDLARAAFALDYAAMLKPLLVVLGYGIVIYVLSIIIFKKKMKQ